MGVNLQGLGTGFAAVGAGLSGTGGVLLDQAATEGLPQPIDPLGLAMEAAVPDFQLDLVTVALGGAAGYGIATAMKGNGLVGGIVGAIAAPLLRSTLGV